MRPRAGLLLLVVGCATFGAATSARAQGADTVSSASAANPASAAGTLRPLDTAPVSTPGAARVPFIPGGYDDKPYVEGVFGRVRLGGYVEAAGTWERADGATEELGFQVSRLNLLTSTVLRERVEVWTEIEFEDGGEEIVLELAQVDVRLHPLASLRGGILLLPLGRFNLAHDAPRNELPRRPALATDLLGSALSQPGLGAFGRFAAAAGRVTYEAYGITGYDSNILDSSPDGTRLPLGKANREDLNASPAWVGRLEWSRGFSGAGGQGFAAALSGYHGAYNIYRIEGIDVDDRRDVRVGVGDVEISIAGVRLAAEGALVRVDIPEGLTGLYASRQSGAFVEASRTFGRGWITSLPLSHLTAVVRAEAVDFDRDLAGDSQRALTAGVNFRPIPETCLKLAFTRGESRDRFNNLGANAAWVFGLATYF
jgi:hypothetical protein